MANLFPLPSFMCGRTENEDHPVRMMFGVHSFCSCFVGESASYI